MSAQKFAFSELKASRGLPQPCHTDERPTHDPLRRDIDRASIA